MLPLEPRGLQLLLPSLVALHLVVGSSQTPGNPHSHPAQWLAREWNSAGTILTCTGVGRPAHLCCVLLGGSSGSGWGKLFPPCSGVSPSQLMGLLGSAPAKQPAEVHAARRSPNRPCLAQDGGWIRPNSWVSSPPIVLQPCAGRAKPAGNRHHGRHEPALLLGPAQRLTPQRRCPFRHIIPQHCSSTSPG